MALCSKQYAKNLKAKGQAAASQALAACKAQVVAAGSTATGSISEASVESSSCPAPGSPVQASDLVFRVDMFNFDISAPSPMWIATEDLRRRRGACEMSSLLWRGSDGLAAPWNRSMGDGGRSASPRRVPAEKPSEIGKLNGGGKTVGAAMIAADQHFKQWIANGSAKFIDVNAARQVGILPAPF